MKTERKPPFALNHMQLVFVDSRHNFFHYLLVMMIRLFFFLIFTPVAAYLFALGSFFSSESTKIYLSPKQIEIIDYYFQQLPFFLKIKNLFLAQIQKIPFWWTLVIGLPLITASLVVFLTNFFNLLFSIFSSGYNHTHCPLCKEPMKIEKKNQLEAEE